VSALDEVEVRAQVVEQYAPHIRVGMEVSVQIPAIPGPPLSGVVTAIVPQADVQARTFPVKVRVKNTLTEDGPVVKSGMYARVMLPTGRKQLAMLASKDALVLGGDQPILFVVETRAADSQQGKVRPVPVQLGFADGSLIQVSGNIQAGQLVVVQGNERLQPGQDVKIQRTLPEPEGAARSAQSAPKIQ
jgi:multidrug efflux pump subunit AcrA (membrane-fusion protein)